MAPCPAPSGCSLYLTGIIDGPDQGTGVSWRAVELYATAYIGLLDSFSLGPQHNGYDASADFHFPRDPTPAGSYLHVASNATLFRTYFGFAPKYESSKVANGSAAMELYCGQTVVDVYGCVDSPGYGDYTGGWAYRINGTASTGAHFDRPSWFLSGPNALGGFTENGQAGDLAMPLRTYACALDASALVLTGVVHRPDFGAVELYALAAVPYLVAYSLAVANRGTGNPGPEIHLPPMALAEGSFVYVASAADAFAQYFGFAPNYTEADLDNTGGDAVVLFLGPTVADVYGDVSTDGVGEYWDYTQGWARRKSGLGPDGGSFMPGSWVWSGAQALVGVHNNSQAEGVGEALPLGTYTKDTCVCERYRNGAGPADRVVCGKKEAGVVWCMPPNPGDGLCPGDHAQCVVGCVAVPPAPPNARLPRARALVPAPHGPVQDVPHDGQGQKGSGCTWRKEAEGSK